MAGSVVLIALYGAILCAQLDAQDREGSAELESAGNTHVLIVSGICKDLEERRIKDEAVSLLRSVLEEHADTDPDRIVVLVDDASEVLRSSGRSTAAGLEDALDKLARRVKPADTFVFYYIGQANIVARKLRFNVRGPDFTHEKLTELIDRVPSSTSLVVLDCPAAGLAVKSLAREGRIVICAARSDQPYSTRFSTFFVPALMSTENDADGDGRISLLEAFQRTAAQLDESYSSQGLMCTEIPLLEDDGDGVPSQHPWERTPEEKDGLAASRFFLLARPLERTGP